MLDEDYSHFDFKFQIAIKLDAVISEVSINQNTIDEVNFLVIDEMSQRLDFSKVRLTLDIDCLVLELFSQV